MNKVNSHCGPSVDRKERLYFFYFFWLLKSIDLYNYFLFVIGLYQNKSSVTF